MGECPYCEAIPYQYNPDEVYYVCNKVIGLKRRKHCPFAELENWEDCKILKTEMKKHE